MSYDDDAESGLSKLRYNKRQSELPKELQGDCPCCRIAAMHWHLMLGLQHADTKPGSSSCHH